MEKNSSTLTRVFIDPSGESNLDSKVIFSEKMIDNLARGTYEDCLEIGFNEERAQLWAERTRKSFREVNELELATN